MFKSASLSLVALSLVAVAPISSLVPHADARRVARLKSAAVNSQTTQQPAQPTQARTTQPAPDFAALEATALAEMRETNTPGAAIAVVSGDRVLFAKGFGVASVETKEPVTAETLFRIASTTKIFTAAAALSLVEDGRLKLDAPVGDFAKGLSPKIARLTLSRLLSHTSGMADSDKEYGPHDDAALGETARALGDASLFEEPGKIFSYSNVGFDLVGYLVEQASGKSYAQTVRERVLVPAGMRRSVFRPTVAMTYPFSQAHAEDERTGAIKVVRPFPDNAAQFPSGYLFSNASELARFAVAFLNQGRLDGKQVLSPSIIRSMMTPRADMHVPTKEAEHWQYGYGMLMRDYRGVRLFEHGGDMLGFGCLFQMIPERRFAVVILTNKSDSQLTKTAARAAEMFVPLTAETPTHFKSIPISAEERALVAGRYVNSAQLSAELFAQGDKLVAKITTGDEQETAPVVKVAELTYVAVPKGGEQLAFVIVNGADGKPAYLCADARCFKRVR